MEAYASQTLPRMAGGIVIAPAISEQNTPLFPGYPSSYYSTYVTLPAGVERKIEAIHRYWGYWEFAKSDDQHRAKALGLDSPEAVILATVYAFNSGIKGTSQTLDHCGFPVGWNDLDAIKIVWRPGRYDGTKGLRNGLPECAYNHVLEIRARRERHGYPADLSPGEQHVYTGTHFRWYLEPKADLRYVRQWINNVNRRLLNLGDPTDETVIAGFPEWTGRSLYGGPQASSHILFRYAHPLYLKAADRRLKPDDYLPYQRPSDTDVDDDIWYYTSYHPAVEGATEDDFRESCDVINEPQEDYPPEPQSRWEDPPTILNADGEPMSDPEDAGYPILDYPHLPMRICRNQGFWQAELWKRLDTRVTPRDLDARKIPIPPGTKRKRSRKHAATGSAAGTQQMSKKSKSGLSGNRGATGPSGVKDRGQPATRTSSEKRPRYESYDSGNMTESPPVFDSNMPGWIDDAATTAVAGPSSSTGFGYTGDIDFGQATSTSSAAQGANGVVYGNNGYMSAGTFIQNNVNTTFGSATGANRYESWPLPENPISGPAHTKPRGLGVQTNQDGLMHAMGPMGDGTADGLPPDQVGAQPTINAASNGLSTNLQEQFSQMHRHDPARLEMFDGDSFGMGNPAHMTSNTGAMPACAHHQPKAQPRAPSKDLQSMQPTVRSQRKRKVQPLTPPDVAVQAPKKQRLSRSQQKQIWGQNPDIPGQYREAAARHPFATADPFMGNQQQKSQKYQSKQSKAAFGTDKSIPSSSSVRAMYVSVPDQLHEPSTELEYTAKGPLLNNLLEHYEYGNPDEEGLLLNSLMEHQGSSNPDKERPHNPIDGDSAEQTNMANPDTHDTNEIFLTEDIIQAIDKVVEGGIFDLNEFIPRDDLANLDNPRSTVPNGGAAPFFERTSISTDGQVLSSKTMTNSYVTGPQEISPISKSSEGIDIESNGISGIGPHASFGIQQQAFIGHEGRMTEARTAFAEYLYPGESLSTTHDLFGGAETGYQYLTVEEEAIRNGTWLNEHQVDGSIDRAGEGYVIGEIGAAGAKEINAHDASGDGVDDFSVIEEGENNESVSNDDLAEDKADSSSSERVSGDALQIAHQPEPFEGDWLSAHIDSIASKLYGTSA